MLFDNQFRRDGTIGRVEKGTGKAEEDRQYKEMPQVQQLEPGQQGNHQDGQRAGCVSTYQYLAAGQAIGSNPNKQREQQFWYNLGCQKESHGQARARQLVDGDSQGGGKRTIAEG